MSLLTEGTDHLDHAGSAFSSDARWFHAGLAPMASQRGASSSTLVRAVVDLMAAVHRVEHGMMVMT